MSYVNNSSSDESEISSQIQNFHNGDSSSNTTSIPSYFTSNSNSTSTTETYESLTHLATNEMEESGNGGDSDEEHETFMKDIQHCCANIAMLRLDEFAAEELTILEDGNELLVEEDTYSEEEEARVTTAPIPKVPDDWHPHAPNLAAGEPASFSSVDNPGGWDEYCFRPKFTSTRGGGRKKYMYFCLPTGAVPVKADSSGKQIDGGWEFFYNGWESNFSFSNSQDGQANDPHVFRDGATRDNLFPGQ